MRWWLLVAGLEFPAVLALIDCFNRPDDAFEAGADDHRSWNGWMLVAAATAWLMVGYLIVLGYYFVVVRRNSFSRP